MIEPTQGMKFSRKSKGDSGRSMKRAFTLDELKIILAEASGEWRSMIGKTWLYSQLDINGGDIVTSLIRKRNARQGTRLVNVDSMRAFINKGIGVQGDCNTINK